MLYLDVELLIALLAAHVIGDFLLQTQHDVLNKKSPAVFIKHILMVTGLSYLLPGAWNLWQIPVITGLTHTFIDWVKVHHLRQYKPWKAFTIDQSAHLLVIVLLTAFLSTQVDYNLFWFTATEAFASILIAVTGGIVTVKLGGILIGFMTSSFHSQMQLSDGEMPGLKQGGKIIGELERLLIFFFVMAGVFEAVAFLVAAKSVFRFGELKDKGNRKEAEYIIIGTLMSYAWGVIFSWLTATFMNL